MEETAEGRAGRLVELAKQRWLAVGNRFYGRRWSVHDPIPRQRSVLGEGVRALKRREFQKAERLASQVIEECRTMEMTLSTTQGAIDEVTVLLKSSGLPREERGDVAKLLIKAMTLFKVRKYPEARAQAEAARSRLAIKVG